MEALECARSEVVGTLHEAVPSNETRASGRVARREKAAVVHEALSSLPDRQAEAVLPDGGFLLVAGKGHETWQETHGRRVAFSDAAVAAKALAASEGER